MYAFVRLPMEDFSECYKIINRAIKENWQEKYLPIIQKTKKYILKNMMLQHRIFRDISGDIDRQIYGEDIMNLLRLSLIYTKCSSKNSKSPELMFNRILYSGSRYDELKDST